jgi:hypothetical protein
MYKHQILQNPFKPGLNINTAQQHSAVCSSVTYDYHNKHQYFLNSIACLEGKSVFSVR